MNRVLAPAECVGLLSGRCVTVWQWVQVLVFKGVCCSQCCWLFVMVREETPQGARAMWNMEGGVLAAAVCVGMPPGRCVGVRELSICGCVVRLQWVGKLMRFGFDVWCFCDRL